MRFVDEFRDPRKAQTLAARIITLCEQRRHYKFMSLCRANSHDLQA